MLNVIIDNNQKYWEVNQYIRMISEGLCDTEDWSNGAENSLHDSNIFNFKIITIENRYFKLQ